METNYEKSTKKLDEINKENIKFKESFKSPYEKFKESFKLTNEFEKNRYYTNKNFEKQLGFIKESGKTDEELDDLSPKNNDGFFKYDAINSIIQDDSINDG